MRGTDSHWRLSGFYFWYYAALGAFTPYFARWVHDSGHGALAASATLALWYGTRVVAPNSWSLLCARSPRPLFWLRAGAAVSAFGFAGFLWFDSLAGVLATMLVFSFFANAIMPQFEALTLDRLGAQRAAYGRIRVWGSIGFLLIAAGYGPLLEQLGGEWMPWLMLPLLLAMFASTLLVPAAAAPINSSSEALPAAPSLRSVIARREVRDFLLIGLLMQIGFGPFYVFYTLHLGEHGQTGNAIGLLWGAGVLAEVAMFLLMSRVFGRLSAQRVILLAALATTVRWLLVAVLADSFALMLFAQLLHALSFGAFHAACMHRLAGFFPGRLAQHGQSLFYGFSSGVGGVLGALLAGLGWQLGHGFGAFLIGAAAAALAVLIALRDRPAAAACA